MTGSADERCNHSDPAPLAIIADKMGVAACCPCNQTHHVTDTIKVWV